MYGVSQESSLKDLKTTYRGLMKEWHPDKFQDGDDKQEEAEQMSRKIIDGYHFLVSIAPETKAANKSEYKETITNTGIADFNHKGQVREGYFIEGTTYK